MAWSLVTPASRGIGFAITRHLLETSNAPVLATARVDPVRVKKSLLKDLNDVDPDRLTVVELDVTDEASISAAAEKAKSLFSSPSHHLRLAFAIPGVLHPEKSPAQIDAQNALETFRINALGPLLLIKHFSPFLPRKTTNVRSEHGLPSHAVWSSMAARVGSTTDNRKGGWYSYRASKAAVISLMKTFDLQLQQNTGRDRSAMAIALHPGTVKTNLSKNFWNSTPSEELFSPEIAAERLVDIVRNCELERGGRCWDWKGEEVLP